MVREGSQAGVTCTFPEHLWAWGALGDTEWGCGGGSCTFPAGCGLAEPGRGVSTLPSHLSPWFVPSHKMLGTDPAAGRWAGHDSNRWGILMLGESCQLFILI